MVFKIIFRSVVKRCLRHPFATPFVALWLTKHIQELFPERNSSPAPLTLLVFSSERWMQDLEALAKLKSVKLLAIESNAILRINALFTPGYFPGNSDLYYKEQNENFIKRRETHIQYLEKVLWFLNKFCPFHASVSCAFKYIREVPWAAASHKINIPFVSWHKEFTVLHEEHVPQRIQEAKAFGFKFFGTHLTCVNKTASDLLAGAEIFPASQISQIGLLRADNLFRKREMRENPKKSVVLFSFGHLTGPFPVHPFRNYYFSKNDDFGFVELFKKTHATFASLASYYPHIEFLIKPKNVEPGWFGEIEAAIEQELGASLQDIPNCKIVGTPAQQLMENSLANIVLNSTTVIESRLLGCNTILPVFAEAAEQHADMVYFRSYFDLFSIAHSSEELCLLLKRSIEGEKLVQGSDERLKHLLTQQIGNPDGKSCERLFGVISQIIHNSKSVKDQTRKIDKAALPSIASKFKL